MTDITTVCITSTPELALKKLKKAEIPVYNCKKDGARFIFAVKDKEIKKVFAIFSKPCYNISVKYNSKKERVLRTVLNRIGLIVGAALFACIAAVSNSFIFKISVTGSGSYLEAEVRRIIYESGAKEYARYNGFDKPLATGKILSLPRVTFCNIEKRGSILTVDVETDEEHVGSVIRTPLVSDIDGVVKNIVAICGTAVKSGGDSVKKGDVLIAAQTLAGETVIESIAVGYAEIEYGGTYEYPAEAESDACLRDAYAALLLNGDEILTRSHTVTATGSGVTYVIEFTCLHKLIINME